MVLAGTMVDSLYQFGETQILAEQTGPTWYWCIKHGDLNWIDSLQKLEGPWSAPGCNPGTIELFRLAILSDTVFCWNEPVLLEVSGENIQWYADPNLDTLLATGNTFSPQVSSKDTFYITQTHYSTESPAIRISVRINTKCTISSLNTRHQVPCTLHPNPALGYFSIESPKAAIQSVELYDLTGRRLPVELQLERHEAKVRYRYQGLAIAQVLTDRGGWTQKVLLE
ncbi:MAG: hypothetical protein AAF399_17295, partial [Bacteroidota bacterium]